MSDDESPKLPKLYLSDEELEQALKDMSKRGKLIILPQRDGSWRMQFEKPKSEPEELITNDPASEASQMAQRLEAAGQELEANRGLWERNFRWVRDEPMTLPKPPWYKRWWRRFLALFGLVLAGCGGPSLPCHADLRESEPSPPVADGTCLIVELADDADGYVSRANECPRGEGRCLVLLEGERFQFWSQTGETTPEYMDAELPLEPDGSCVASCE